MCNDLAKAMKALDGKKRAVETPHPLGLVDPMVENQVGVRSVLPVAPQDVVLGSPVA